MTLTKTHSTQIDEEQTLETGENSPAKGTQTIPHNLEQFSLNRERLHSTQVIQVILGLEPAQNLMAETQCNFLNMHSFVTESQVKNSSYNLESNILRTLIWLEQDSFATCYDTDLDAKINTYPEQTPKTLLNKLLDMGFAWNHVASMIHVPVHIVRDLDCDEGNSENLPETPHKNLAQLLALIEMLEEKLPNRNIASWLETALDGYYYSGIDVISRNQIDLLVKYADGEISNTELLDKCFPDWRNNFDERIEIFTASDGENSIRLRNDNLED